MFGESGVAKGVHFSPPSFTGCSDDVGASSAGLYSTYILFSLTGVCIAMFMERLLS